MNIISEVHVPLVASAVRKVAPNAIKAAEFELTGNKFVRWQQTNLDAEDGFEFQAYLVKPDSKPELHTLRVEIEDDGDAARIRCEFDSESVEMTPDFRKLFDYTIALLETAVS